ncbi:MAG TPA: radical SAM protein [Hyphomicrobiaceae bacterium]|nr:radical SAM protein [Hyphomicrobiaceae bacterium]
MAEGPLLVFGGPYGNLQAMTALLAEADRLGIPAARIICTGDLAAYCADPAATIELVRASGIRVVMGNCDEQLALGADDCACGFPQASTCARLSAEWYAHANRQVGAEARRWLATLPKRIDVEIAGRRLAVIHGGVRRINKYIFASSPLLLKQQELALAGTDGVIAGHCGLPFSQIVDGRLWHNAGAIGLPANDGTPHVWFSLLAPVAGGVRIEHRPLTYDHAAAACAMREAGLGSEYRQALSSGLWPSCEVLPYREVCERGVPLKPGSFLWEAGPSPVYAPRRRRRSRSLAQLWPPPGRRNAKSLDAGKFKDPLRTASGEPRASVAMKKLETLWFNTGTLCNIACRNCYIESSPRNDRLVYLSLADIRPYLDEIERDRLGTEQIGFTGGEPFMNPDIGPMLEECLARGYRVLVLTNAMRPMQRPRIKRLLLDLNRGYGARLVLRVSLDHYTAERHEDERGMGTFAPTLEGLIWLARNGFKVAVAGRTMWGEDEASERAGYQRLFDAHAIPLDASDPASLVLFPEMDAALDVPEITTACWSILGKRPEEVMCATSRMVVKRKGETAPVVLSCTLIPYDPAFQMGATLADSARPVPLNHPHCARFCVLGGASCAPAGKAAAAGTTSRDEAALV